MILTLTPNPSVDRTISVDQLSRGHVHRATGTRVDPGGKGLNVSRALTLHDVPTLAVLPLGGPLGHLMRELLHTSDTPALTVPIHQCIRVNITLVEPDGTTTKINEPGPALDPTEIESLLTATVEAHHAPGTWVAGCGSLPDGAPPQLYADLIGRLRGRGARIAVDTSGPALHAAVAAGPDLIKPNRHELGELVGADLTRLGDVIDAAKSLLDRGVGEVLVSLGRDGAVLVTADDVIRAHAPVARPVSTVGAGDCTLAGYLLACRRGADPDRALATAVAFGAAAVALPGSAVPGPEQVDAVRPQVELRPDPGLPLDD
ncbi:ATP-dependent 6-phosphofructokinase isozyme 2 [Austwickia sp. TVS 96-490-7B]|uniref:1-phosphofructokinase n=1 Tax=Austwickia sp. TVS 96-490-7B TaxID=2830843 RepID=UPI001C59177D|nr:1-phosphofructokinase [Austwickia sp. TVS 96-490-7B]MBW3086145.1 ATP-dependent 6-phosphofructokinase isozyme 2 [Austwickia sp. TVS 96-490-7B]